MTRRIATGVAALILLSMCEVFRQPLEIERAPHGVIVRCEALGEYASNIQRIEVGESSTASIIWRVEAKKSSFQLHNFALVAGSNRSVLLGDTETRTTVPRSSQFVLMPGTKYWVEVCPPGFRRCRRREFVL